MSKNHEKKKKKMQTCCSRLVCPEQWVCYMKYYKSHACNHPEICRIVHITQRLKSRRDNRINRGARTGLNSLLVANVSCSCTAREVSRFRSWLLTYFHAIYFQMHSDQSIRTNFETWSHWEPKFSLILHYSFSSHYVAISKRCKQNFIDWKLTIISTNFCPHPKLQYLFGNCKPSRFSLKTFSFLNRFLCLCYKSLDMQAYQGCQRPVEIQWVFKWKNAKRRWLSKGVISVI